MISVSESESINAPKSQSLHKSRKVRLQELQYVFLHSIHTVITSVCTVPQDKQI